MKTATKKKDKYAVDSMSAEEAREFFNNTVRENFGIEASEFIKNYQAGSYEDRDDCDMMSLLMLLPFTGYSAEYGKKQKR